MPESPRELHRKPARSLFEGQRLTLFARDLVGREFLGIEDDRIQAVAKGPESPRHPTLEGLASDVDIQPDEVVDEVEVAAAFNLNGPLVDVDGLRVKEDDKAQGPEKQSFEGLHTASRPVPRLILFSRL